VTPHDLMKMTAEALECLDIPYFVTGSLAAMAYSEFRTTLDVDIVIAVGPRDVPGLLHAFASDDFYIDAIAVRRAVEAFDQFNVIHHPSSYKLDFMVVDDDGYDASRLSRRRRITLEGVPIWVAAPEDVILKKLMYYREGGSDKHLRDIASMFKVSGDQIDRAYGEHWAMRLGVSDLWRYMIARVEGQEPGPSV
jgi:hypothetical protein